MKTITRISGVDCKIGRNSRTGSTVSLTIDDMDIIDVVGYYNDIKEGKEPSGKIKKIELHLLYEDDLKAEVKLPDTKELDLVLDQGANIDDVGFSELNLNGKNIEICGNCDSTNIAREKRPNGKVWCIDCGFVIKEGGAFGI